MNTSRITNAYRPGAPSTRRFRSLEPEGDPNVRRPTKAEATRSFNRAMRKRGQARREALAAHFALVRPNATGALNRYRSQY